MFMIYIYVGGYICSSPKLQILNRKKTFDFVWPFWLPVLCNKKIYGVELNSVRLVVQGKQEPSVTVHELFVQGYLQQKKKVTIYGFSWQRNLKYESYQSPVLKFFKETKMNFATERVKSRNNARSWSIG